MRRPLAHLALPGLTPPRSAGAGLAAPALAAVLLAAAAGAWEHPSDLQVDPGMDVPYFYEYDPPSTLAAPEAEVTRAKYPFVDVHNHQPSLGEQDLDALAAEMDAINMIEYCVM